MSTNGPFIAVLIARTHDRIPLCSYTDPAFASGSTIRQQEQRILERIKLPSGQDAKGSLYQSFDNKDVTFFVFTDAATDLTVIAALNKLLTRSDADRNRVACQLLDLVFSEFIAMHPVEQIGQSNLRPFHFIKFDLPLQKIISRMAQQEKRAGGSSAGAGARQNAAAASGSTQYDTLKAELSDVHVVIRQNLDDLLTRGEKLETMNSYSEQLKDQSAKYYKKTVHMNRMRALQLYGPPAAVITVLLVFFYFYFF